MKFVQIIINHIIIPITTIIFILGVGLSAAGISALIEYCVLKELFVSQQHNQVPTSIVVAIFVIVFEYAKIYLHFISGKLQRLPSGGNLNNRRFCNRIRWSLRILVTISFICSAIFAVTTLNLSTYNKTSINQEVLFLKAKLQEDISTIEQQYTTAYANSLQPYVDARLSAENTLRDFNPTGFGPQTVAKIYNSLQNAVNISIRNYETTKNSLILEKDQKIEKARADTIAETESKIAELTDTSSSTVAPEYDNNILSHFLLVITQTISQKSIYSKSLYLIVTIIFSLVISLILELLISICINFLSYPVDTLAETKIERNEKLLKWCNNLVLRMFRAFCTIFIYVIIMLMFTLSMNKKVFFVAISSFFIATTLVRKFVSAPSINATAENDFINALKTSMLEGVVSFIGYIILGFFLGNSAVNIDISTYAVAIGSTLSGLIGLSH